MNKDDKIHKPKHKRNESLSWHSPGNQEQGTGNAATKNYLRL